MYEQFKIWITRLLFRYMSFSAWKNVSLPDDVSTTDIEIPLDNRKLFAKVFQPHDKTLSKRKPLVLFFHSGGTCLGSVKDTHYNGCVLFASLLKCTLVGVDYRLAPENPFPCGPDDAIATTKWIAEHLNDDDAFESRHNGKLVVMGESAGGALAIVACLNNHKDAAALAGAILLYPMTESTSAGFESYQTFATGHLLTADLMYTFWKNYLQMSCEEFEKVNGSSPEILAKAFPLQTPEFVLQENMPKTFLVTCEYDPLRDDAKALGVKLKNAGVEVECHHYKDEHTFMFTNGKNENYVDCVQKIESWIDSL